MTGFYIRDAGTWKTPTSVSIKDAGTWKTIQNAYIRVAGVWKQFYVAFAGEDDHYTTPASGAQTIPNGASQVVITVRGAGSSGGSSAQGAGGLAIATRSISAADWGGELSYSVGAKSFGGGLAGGSSTVSGTITAGTLSITASGGTYGLYPGNGYINGGATGGDTNTGGGAANGGATAGDGSVEFNFT